jgi:hypothetical protein
VYRRHPTFIKIKLRAAPPLRSPLARLTTSINANRQYHHSPIMKLTYEASREDIAETGIRMFFRGKAFATTRRRGAILCAVMFTVFAFLGFHARENVNLAVVCVAAAAWGAGLFLLTYKGAMRRRIQKYMTTEMHHSVPLVIVHEIKDGTITRTASGSTQAFSLADFTGSNEDARYLELAFGDKGVCVIPLRAFPSTETKSAFLSAIGRPITSG